LPTPLLRMAVTAVIAFGLDRFSKIVIVHWLDLSSVQVIHVWPPYLDLVMAWNTGVNFGLLGDYGGRWMLVAFAIIFSVAIAIWTRHKSGWVLPLSVGIAVGGALGNAFDRVVYAAVADYLNMSCCGIRNPYSFNVADIFVFFGMVLVAISLERRSGAASQSFSDSNVIPRATRSRNKGAGSNAQP
jgi:signal peptidase II